MQYSLEILFFSVLLAAGCVLLQYTTTLTGKGTFDNLQQQGEVATAMAFFFWLILRVSNRHF